MRLRLSTAILATLLLSLVIVGCNGAESSPPGSPTSTSSPSPTPVPTSSATALRIETPVPTSISAPRMRSIPEIIKLLGSSVVHVQTEAVQLDQFNRQVPATGVGTGQVFDRQGHILTNNHVVEGARQIVVTLSDGRAFEAAFIGGDLTLDLAVLRVDAEGLVPIPIGESSRLEVGDQVVAIGHALNLDSFVERPVRDGPWSARVSGREAPRAVGC